METKESNVLVPEAGMGCTRLSYTDRDPYTITRVHKNGKRFWMKADNYTRLDQNGMSESQEYSYTLNVDNPECEVRLRKDGRWCIVKGPCVSIGYRRRYYDYSF